MAVADGFHCLESTLAAMSANTFLTLPGRCSRASSQLVSHDFSALHYEPYALHLGDILQRVSRDCDEVGELAFFDAAQTFLCMNDPGIHDCCHAQRIGRACAPFHEQWKHLSLCAMRTVA